MSALAFFTRQEAIKPWDLPGTRAFPRLRATIDKSGQLSTTPCNYRQLRPKVAWLATSPQTGSSAGTQTARLASNGGVPISGRAHRSGGRSVQLPTTIDNSRQ